MVSGDKSETRQACLFSELLFRIVLAVLRGVLMRASGIPSVGMDMEDRKLALLLEDMIVNTKKSRGGLKNFPELTDKPSKAIGYKVIVQKSTISKCQERAVRS